MTETITNSDGSAVATTNRISGNLDVQSVGTLKVAIVGMAPSSRMEAPFNDPSWEIWTISNAYQFLPKWDRYFELHDPYSRRDRYPTLWEFLIKQHGKPIYVNQPCPEIPDAVVFPINDVINRFGGMRYFTNQISYLVAYAIHLGAKEIALYGVDMAQQMQGEASEYAYQRPSCEFWLGWAAGAGIKLTVHPKSDILKASCLYGIEADHGALRVKWKARLKELQQQVDAHDAAYRDANNKLWMHRGAKDGFQSCIANAKLKGIEPPEEWSKEIVHLEQQIKQLEELRQEHLCKAYMFRGASDDMNWWSEWIYTDWDGQGRERAEVMP